MDTGGRTRPPSQATAVALLPQRMIAAWNRGSGEEFAAPFTDTADFIAFDGTHLKGRAVIAAFHQNLFDAELKGSRLEGGVKFVHFLQPQVAVMHAVASMSLPGEPEPAASRDSMQLFVAVENQGQWRLEAVLNARRLTLQRQSFWDAFESLPPEVQREVVSLVDTLSKRIGR
ncbi:MAG TPA: SgcJ/EcaC family oxidoreductase [Povalibacter sp.]|nr:SgcJ/EcaC family oxidoreductase [Povalibacter sp.]